MIRHLLIDRDGTLNVAREEAVRTIEDFEWAPGAKEALALAKEMGMRVSVVTNQSAVARGLLNMEELTAIHNYMTLDAPDCIADFFVCPHAEEDNCACRKPKPLLLSRAMLAAHSAPIETMMIGNSDSDIGAAHAVGCWSARVGPDKTLLQVIEELCSS